MGYPKLRVLTVGVGAAIGVFGVAAMLSAAAAPTARADDFTDIVNAVNSDLSLGQTELTAAFTDFSSNHVPLGLSALFAGMNQDLWAAPTNLEVGTIEALTGEGITGPITVSVGVPSDFSDALSTAETLLAAGQANFTDAATALLAGDYGLAALDNALGSLLTVYLPGQELFIGAVEALGL